MLASNKDKEKITQQAMMCVKQMNARRGGQKAKLTTTLKQATTSL
jgi:hypothetical protein